MDFWVKKKYDLSDESTSFQTGPFDLESRERINLLPSIQKIVFFGLSTDLLGVCASASMKEYILALALVVSFENARPKQQFFRENAFAQQRNFIFQK